jgi:hypothetical protein
MGASNYIPGTVPKPGNWPSWLRMPPLKKQPEKPPKTNPVPSPEAETSAPWWSTE